MDGRQLRDALQKMGVTAKDLANLMGCSTQNVYAIFGKPSIGTGTLESVARAIGKPLVELLKNDEDSEDLRRQLQEKDAEIARLNERIDKLLGILEKR